MDLSAPYEQKRRICLEAIKEVESSGQYHAMSWSFQEFGAYKFNNEIWREIVSKETLEIYPTAKDAPKHIQDEAAQIYFDKLHKHFGNATDTVRAWKVGVGEAKADGFAGRDYLKKVNSALKK